MVCQHFNSSFTKPVALFIAAGNIINDVRTFALQVQIDGSHRSHAIHVIVTVNRNSLTIFKCLRDSCNGFVHILHQKRIMQRRHIRVYKGIRLIGRIIAPVIKQSCGNGRNANPLCNTRDLLIGFALFRRVHNRPHAFSLQFIHDKNPSSISFHDPSVTSAPKEHVHIIFFQLFLGYKSIAVRSCALHDCKRGVHTVNGGTRNASRITRSLSARVNV